MTPGPIADYVFLVAVTFGAVVMSVRDGDLNAVLAAAQALEGPGMRREVAIGVDHVVAVVHEGALARRRCDPEVVTAVGLQERTETLEERAKFGLIDRARRLIAPCFTRAPRYDEDVEQPAFGGPERGQLLNRGDVASCASDHKTLRAGGLLAVPAVRVLERKILVAAKESELVQSGCLFPLLDRRVPRERGAYFAPSSVSLARLSETGRYSSAREPSSTDRNSLLTTNARASRATLTYSGFENESSRLASLKASRT